MPIYSQLTPAQERVLQQATHLPFWQLADAADRDAAPQNYHVCRLFNGHVPLLLVKAAEPWNAPNMYVVNLKTGRPTANSKLRATPPAELVEALREHKAFEGEEW